MVSYLLVVSVEHEVLGCLAHCGDSVHLKNLCSLCNKYHVGYYLLQSLFSISSVLLLFVITMKYIQVLTVLISLVLISFLMLQQQGEMS